MESFLNDSGSVCSTGPELKLCLGFLLQVLFFQNNQSILDGVKKVGSLGVATKKISENQYCDASALPFTLSFWRDSAQHDVAGWISFYMKEQCEIRR